jgi:hypothetical protein
MTPEEASSAGIVFGEYTEGRSGERSVMIEVTNTGKVPIDGIKLDWVYQYEVPQDATEEFLARHGGAFTRATGQKPAQVNATGRRFPFSLPEGERVGPLRAGETRTYLYPPAWLPGMRSLVQSLSPERYHVAITINGREAVAIPGPVFGAFVERRFGAGDTA